VSPMRTRPSLALLVLLLLLAAAVPKVAMASGKDVLRDCADDEVLTKTYTQSEYRAALNQLATDSSEYSNCEDIIRRAQLDAASGRKHDSGPGGGGAAGGTSGGGGATPSTGGGGSSGAPGSPAPAAKGSDPLAGLNFDERKALDQARSGAGGAQVALGAGPAVAPPGATRAPNVAGDAGLPGPVAALLVLLAAAAVLVAGTRIRSRVADRRPA
jgi:type II secretory pathway pseudopilin PulG